MRVLTIVSTHFEGEGDFRPPAQAPHALARFLPYDMWLEVFCPKFPFLHVSRETVLANRPPFV